MDGATPDDDAAVRAALADAAGALRDELGPLGARVDAAVSAAVPTLDSDADVRRARLHSSEANIADMLALLADPNLPVDSGVPPEALSLGTTLVRRGIDPGDLVHGYLVGQNEVLRAWMEALAERLPSAPQLIAALEQSSARIFGRADFLVAQVTSHVERERKRWVGSARARRGRLIQGLLAGDEATAPEASRARGYDLERWLLAAALWDTESRGENHERLEEQAAVAARAAGAPRALTFAPGEGSVWAWIGTREEPDLDAVAAALEASLRAGEGIALGMPAQGLEGFRQSHGDALHARRVAELGAARGVIRYDAVETVSLISCDLDRLPRFVRRTLGDLAALDEPTARLRETLLAWLAEGGNARRAGERMHAHKNTVLYRLQRAQQIRGRPLAEDRGALELALTAMERLGERALHPSG